MKNRKIKLLISILLSMLLVLESSISVAAISDVNGDCEAFNNTGRSVEGATSGNAEAGTDENLDEVEALLEIKDNDGDEMEADELDEDEYDGFIYGLKDDASRAEIREMEKEINTLSGDAEVNEVLENKVYTADSIETISEVASADIIDYVEPDYINRLDTYSSTPNDTQYNKCTSKLGRDVSYKNILSTMNVQDVWARGFFGSGDVTVAVLDSGVKADHEELVGKVKENLVVSGDSVTKYKNTAADIKEEGSQAFHGTFVSGIICAENNNGKGISGAMPAVNILSMRIFFTDSEGELGAKNSDIAAAIRLATKKGVDVINMSFGQSHESTEVKAACEAAVAKGIILIASSGNNSSASKNVTATYPAAYDCVIGVGSVDADSRKRSNFSNINVDVMAPGRSSSSVGYVGLNNSYDSNEQYVLGLGTSFAGPQVAALAAMAKSIDKDISAAEFTDALYGTAVDLGDTGFDEEYGYGLVDYEGVLNELVGTDGKAGEGLDISEAEITLDLPETGVVYDSTAKEPTVVSVVLGERTLTANQDYSVKYENNVGVGTAKVIVKGINKYSGKIVKTFTIKPKVMRVIKLKRSKSTVTVSWAAVKKKMPTQRITGYQVQIATDEEFATNRRTATVSGYSKTSKTFTKLKRRTGYYVRVRTYMKVGTKKYYSNWTESASIRTK